MSLGERERRLDSIEARGVRWEGAKEKYFVSITTSFPGLFPFKKGEKKSWERGCINIAGARGGRSFSREVNNAVRSLFLSYSIPSTVLVFLGSMQIVFARMC